MSVSRPPGGRRMQPLLVRMAIDIHASPQPTATARSPGRQKQRFSAAPAVLEGPSAPLDADAAGKTDQHPRTHASWGETGPDRSSLASGSKPAPPPPPLARSHHLPGAEPELARIPPLPSLAAASGASAVQSAAAHSTCGGGVGCALLVGRHCCSAPSSIEAHPAAGGGGGGDGGRPRLLLAARRSRISSAAPLALPANRRGLLRRPPWSWCLACSSSPSSSCPSPTCDRRTTAPGLARRTRRRRRRRMFSSSVVSLGVSASCGFALLPLLPSSSFSFPLLPLLLLLLPGAASAQKGEC